MQNQSSSSQNYNGTSQYKLVAHHANLNSFPFKLCLSIRTIMVLDYLCFSAFFISAGLFSCFGAFAFWDVLPHVNTSVALFMASLFFISTGFLLANDYLKLLANKYSNKSKTEEDQACSFYHFLRYTFSLIGSLGILLGFAYYLYDKHVHSFDITSWNANACLWVGIIGFISVGYAALVIWKHSEFSIPEWLEKLKSSAIEIQKNKSVCDTANKYSVTIGVFAVLNLGVVFVNNYAFASSKDFKDFLGHDPKRMWFYCIISTVCTTVLLTKGYFLDAEKVYEEEVGNEKEKNNKWFAPTFCKGILNAFEIGGIPFQAVGSFFLTRHWPDTKHPVSFSTTQKMYLTFGIAAMVCLACMIKVYNIYLENEYGSNNNQQSDKAIQSISSLSPSGDYINGNKQNSDYDLKSSNTCALVIKNHQGP